MKLSIVILTKNSAVSLKKLLPALNFADEVILVDDNSTDETIELVNKFNVKIISHSLNGDFSQARNLGLSLAKGDWVFYVDSDEVLSEELIQEIQMLISTPSNVVAYKFKRKDYFIDRFLLHGENKANSFVRLAKKNAGKWQGKVHEIWEVEGLVGSVSAALIHDLGSDIEKFINKINLYTTLEAKRRKSQNIEWSLGQTLIYPPAKFMYNYFVRMGILDGYPGLIMAFIMSLHSFSVRIKLYE